MEHSIPHSTFLEWDHLDRIKVLGWRQREGRRCANCGTFPDEWLDDRGRVLIEPPYEPYVVSCQGCRDVAEMTETLDSKDPGQTVTLKTPIHPTKDENTDTN